MLKFVGDIGLYLPDKDAIKFTALDGNTVVGCLVRTSTLAALGARDSDGPKELVDRFHVHRNLLERVARCKWDNGQKKRGRLNDLVVTIEEADLYDYTRLQSGRIPGGEAVSTLGMTHHNSRRPTVHPAYL
jgi:hypothetical protein